MENETMVVPFDSQEMSTVGFQQLYNTWELFIRMAAAAPTPPKTIRCSGRRDDSTMLLFRYQVRLRCLTVTVLDEAGGSPTYYQIIEDEIVESGISEQRRWRKVWMRYRDTMHPLNMLDWYLTYSDAPYFANYCHGDLVPCSLPRLYREMAHMLTKRIFTPYTRVWWKAFSDMQNSFSLMKQRYPEVNQTVPASFIQRWKHIVNPLRHLSHEISPIDLKRLLDLLSELPINEKDDNYCLLGRLRNHARRALDVPEKAALVGEQLQYLHDTVDTMMRYSARSTATT